MDPQLYFTFKRDDVSDTSKVFYLFRTWSCLADSNVEKIT